MVQKDQELQKILLDWALLVYTEDACSVHISKVRPSAPYAFHS